MTRTSTDHRRGKKHDDQRKLSLRKYSMRAERGAGKRDTLHLLVLLQTRRSLGLLHAEPVPADDTGRAGRNLSLALKNRPASFLRDLRLRHLQRIPRLLDRKTGLRQSQGQRQ